MSYVCLPHLKKYKRCDFKNKTYCQKLHIRYSQEISFMEIPNFYMDGRDHTK